jgi:hypothetical protein
MGVVNTTYTFSGTDTITSSKLNNIIDDTTFTSDAIQGDTLQVVSPGKLAVKAGGITSNELASNSVVTAKIADFNVTTSKIADSNVTTAKIADSNVTTAKIADANVTQVKLAPNVAGNGPAFRAYASSTTAIPNGALTKVNLATEDFDTGSYFASSRFTPLVAGYYMITGSVDFISATTNVLAIVFKNGSQSSLGGIGDRSSQVSDLVYLNGTTDYVELFAFQSSGASKNLASNVSGTYLCGYLARSA